KLNALAGADTITVNDLTGTDVTQVNLDLGRTDGASDTVIVNGTAGNDTIKVSNNNGIITVAGLAETVTLANFEAGDQLVINGLAGTDTIDASALRPNLLKLTLNGSDGDDFIIGSQGDDLINGGRGNDTLLGGTGNDTFVWNPGDGSDIIEGQSGSDTLQFNGANIAEKIDITANGTRVRFARDVASIVMDVNGVETINFTVRGGADTITVGDLKGTNATQVNLDLSGTPGSGTGDGAVDHVTATGTAGNDQIQVVANGSSVSVLGLAAQIAITGAEGGAVTDVLTVSGGDGSDTIDASAVPAGSIGLVLDGGAGNDTITGSKGADTLIGGDGNDTFIWNPGDGSDTVEGGAGTDTLLFNGSSIGESFDISANGTRARLSRNVGNVVMDLNGVENVKLNA